ncbi:MAG TPA: Rrf2 family transcriptional regulator [Chthoniobacteraceae bacterium]|nr:Rrf2 family transcriptional regulator [Chthoniobacteraceae bacterium]
MRISKKAEYALRALVTIARQNKSWRIEDLSARENIPIKYLEQILLALRHAGILTSKRGVGGGYTLLRPPSKVSVGEIIRILDGPLAPVPCAVDGATERCSCPDPRTCPVRIVMTDITRDLTEALNERTIDEMVRLVPASDSLAFEI